MDWILRCDVKLMARMTRLIKVRDFSSYSFLMNLKKLSPTVESMYTTSTFSINAVAQGMRHRRYISTHIYISTSMKHLCARKPYKVRCSPSHLNQTYARITGNLPKSCSGFSSRDLACLLQSLGRARYRSGSIYLAIRSGRNLSHLDTTLLALHSHDLVLSLRYTVVSTTCRFPFLTRVWNTRYLASFSLNSSEFILRLQV